MPRCPGAQDESPGAQLGDRAALGELGLLHGEHQVLVAALQRGQHECIAVGKVQVHRRRGDVDLPGDGPKGQGLVVAELVEHAESGGDDLLSETFALATGIAPARLLLAG